jgi:hypothetical protein
MGEYQWNNEEFVCFLLIYVSHVDMEFSAEESARIEKMFSEPTYKKMLEIFENMTDYQAIQEILKYKGVYFPTQESRRELLSQIKQQFFIDGDYSQIEMELFNFMKRML